LRGTKRRRKMNVTIRGITKVAKRGSNAKGEEVMLKGGQEMLTHTRGKRYI
jgi:hypothetical protein